MPTTYTDQFFLIDPFSPPPFGTAMNFARYDIIDQNDDDLIGPGAGDTIDGSLITASYPGDTVTVNVPGVGNVTYTGVTFYLANGQQVFTPNDGQVLENGTFVSSTWVSSEGPMPVSDLGPPCFAAGTRIETDRGLVPVEKIEIGDMVLTLDHGFQQVRWHGTRTVDGTGLFAPVRFAPGVLGNEAALLVSPQHRILLSGWRAELLFGEDEVLVAATHLVDGDRIHRAPTRAVTYHHLMFDRHEIILSEGVATESFHPGDYIMGDPDLLAEIEAIFPEMIDRDCGTWLTARQVVRGREAKLLVDELSNSKGGDRASAYHLS